MIKVNKEARQNSILECAQSIYRDVQESAEKGLDRIEVYFPSDVYSAACEMLEEMFNKENLDFSWSIVRNAPNPYTGKINNFTSERIGDSVRRVLRIF